MLTQTQSGMAFVLGHAATSFNLPPMNCKGALTHSPFCLGLYFEDWSFASVVFVLDH